MDSYKIEKDDIQKVISEHRGNYFFTEACEQAKSRESVLNLLAQYIHFSSIFGAGVACLAGKVAASQDIFKEKNEEVDMATDRSVEVASRIFYAAIDEFGDNNTKNRSTHRKLAQKTLKATAHFFEFNPKGINNLTKPRKPTITTIKRIKEGYCIDYKPKERQLFNGIGFHLLSETLANQEFIILDNAFQKHYPEVVKYLNRRGDYYWIQIHKTVEIEHSNASIEAANMALDYYAGKENKQKIKQWIIEGMKKFSTIQTQFMKGLVNNSIKQPSAPLLTLQREAYVQ